MQFSAYARAYRCRTRASSTPDAGSHQGNLVNASGGPSSRPLGSAVESLHG
jgi:hypothetical protein